MTNPVCDCGDMMVQHASGQESFWMCEDCMCDDQGNEVNCCDYCGTFYPWGSAPFCDCEDYDDTTLDWEDEGWIYDENFDTKDEDSYPPEDDEYWDDDDEEDDEDNY